MIKIGFTGTKQGMTKGQESELQKLLPKERFEFHHGDCIGADTQAHKIAQNAVIFIHPPKNPRFRGFNKSENILPEKDYLERNKDIVDATDYLIAAPKTRTEELRSGTWATIRYALKKNKEVHII